MTSTYWLSLVLQDCLWTCRCKVWRFL